MTTLLYNIQYRIDYLWVRMHKKPVAVYLHPSDWVRFIQEMPPNAESFVRVGGVPVLISIHIPEGTPALLVT